MTEPVSLQPLNGISDPLPPSRRTYRLDIVLAALTLAFAFVAASFAVRNSDFWLHLATGRLIAQGEYTFGFDPFAYTTTGVYWANHAWLFDLVLYAGYGTLGGAGLVVLKAGAVALLAWLLLRLARPDSARGTFPIAIACTLLAVLAMSPRLLLQPACVSLLLLAVCLWLLRRGGRALQALPFVIVLWVNVDSWFLLGPLLVALHESGQWLDPNRDRSSPRWLVPACLAACLCGPHHLHALALPAELSPALWSSSLRHDPRFAGFFASPLVPAALSWGSVNLSAWAYVVLLVLGVLSFILDRSALRTWRLPVFVVFGLLAAWQARLVPFFAVVAGPIAALNLGARPPGPVFAGIARAWLLCACVALLALAWPGWLQGFQRRDRAVAWTVSTDPSLERLTTTLTRWRQQGRLPHWARTFANHPDVAHYCAWFCPQEKCFLDSRLLLFLPVVDEYESMCWAMDPGLPQPLWRSGWAMQEKHAIALVVLYDPDLRRLGPALRQLARPSGWSVWQIDGRAVIASDETAPMGVQLPMMPVFDPERLAFGPPADALPPAPEEGPNALPQPRSWWQGVVDRPSGSSWEAEAAAVYLRLFEEGSAAQQQEQRRVVLAREGAGFAGLFALPGGGVPAVVALASQLALPEVFLPDLDERPPALPLLAVRAGRRAVARHPDDATAWLVLARAYLSLRQEAAEPLRGLPLLARVRHVQAVTALVQAITITPDLLPAHETLARLYAERQHLDLALRHQRICLRLVRKAGRRPNEDQASYTARIEQMEQAVEQIERVVQDNENRFVVRSQKLAGDPLARARLAVYLGLTGKALDEVLLRSSSELYGVEGLRLLLELLLQTGRAADARILLDRKELRRNPNGLGVQEVPGSTVGGQRWSYYFLAYDWFDLCQRAAVGSYAGADEALTRLRKQMKAQGDQIAGALRPGVAWRLASEIGMGAVPGALGLRLGRHVDRDMIGALLVRSLFMPVEWADLHVLAGLLQVERGAPVQAAEHLRLALPMYRRMAAVAPALPGLPLAQRYLRRLQANAPRGNR